MMAVKMIITEILVNNILISIRVERKRKQRQLRSVVLPRINYSLEIVTVCEEKLR